MYTHYIAIHMRLCVRKVAVFLKLVMKPSITKKSLQRIGYMPVHCKLMLCGTACSTRRPDSNYLSKEPTLKSVGQPLASSLTTVAQRPGD